VVTEHQASGVVQMDEMVDQKSSTVNVY